MQVAEELTAMRVCPVCGASAYKHFADERIDPGKINGFTYASRKQPEFMCLRLVRCIDCDLVYAPTPPPPDFLSKAYSEAAYDSSPEALAAAQVYARALTPYIAKLRNCGAAVDIGAGSGPLLPLLRDQGFNPVVGIEPSRAAIDAAPATVQPMLREGMFSAALIADIEPSLLCSFMTLEHLAEPGDFVDEAYRLLEPGGMLALVVHNWRAPLNRLLGLRSPIIDVEHLQLYSPLSVRRLLEKNGFISIELQSIRNIYPLRYWLRLTPLPKPIKTWLGAIFDRMGLSDTQISLPVGNLLAVGFKPMEATH